MMEDKEVDRKKQQGDYLRKLIMGDDEETVADDSDTESPEAGVDDEDGKDLTTGPDDAVADVPKTEPEADSDEDEEETEDLSLEAEAFTEELGFEEAKKIAEELGYSLEDVTEFDESPADQFALTLGGEEWMGFRTEDDAERAAVEQVKNDLETDPAMFNQDWLRSHVFVTPTDARMLGLDMANSRTEEMEASEVLSQTDLESEYEDLDEQISDLETEKNELEEELEDFREGAEGWQMLNDRVEEIEGQLKDLEKEKESFVDDAREKLNSNLADDFEEKIKKDPIGFFVDDQGMYSHEDILNANFIGIDEQEAAQDAVDTDGVAHFMSPYDGNVTEVGDTVWFRQN